MPKFSASSKDKLSQCDIRLGIIALDAVKEIDFKVIVGYRGKDQQDEAFAKGFSKLKYPKSEHNKVPARAFDFIPWPFRGWDAKGIEKDFAAVAKVLKERAAARGVKVVWGGDWDNDPKTDDGWDKPHFQLHKSEK